MNDILTFSFFEQPALTHGVSTRKLGSMKRWDEVFKNNLHPFLHSLGISPEQAIGMQQRHTANVKIVSDANEKIIPETDGLITQKTDLFLYAISADCLPVMFYDPEKKIAGVAHAGYKGLLQGILSRMVQTYKELESDSVSLQVGIGPAIGVCCYNVDRARIEQFGEYTDYFEERDGKVFLNLKTIAVQQLTRAGVLQENIEVSSICTQSNIDNWFSYRGDTKESFGQFATVIGMR